MSLVLPGSGRAAADAYEGRPIVSLRVASLATGQTLSGYLDHIALAVGQPYQRTAIRKALEELDRTGRFADIRVDASARPDGVAVTFLVRENNFIGSVRVTGVREPPGPAELESATRLELGSVFEPGKINEAVANIRGVLEDDGLHDARIEPHVLEELATHQVSIEFAVTPGPRARLRQVNFSGATIFPTERLRRESKLKPGKILTARRVERAIDRLRRFYFRRGYLTAQVQLAERQYHDAGGPVSSSPAARAKSSSLPPAPSLTRPVADLTFSIVAGPHVDVELEGTKLSQKQLHKLLPIYEERTVDDDLLAEGRRNLREFLERAGYFDTEVDYSLDRDPAKNALRLRYDVIPGPRRRLVGVDFQGNAYFSRELLAERIQIRPSSLLWPAHFSRELLRRDEESLRELYRSNGFEQVKVRAQVHEDYRGKEGDLFVNFRMEEGPQTRVKQLTLSGHHAFPQSELLEVIGSTPGQPYSEFNVTSDRDNLLALYYNAGFPYARFSYGVGRNPDSHSVELDYVIDEGAQEFIDRILVSGSEHTRPAILQRELAIHEGEPLAEGNLVETQRRLYDLGIFSKVTIAPQNPSPRETRKTVLVNLEEAKRYTLAYGFGIEFQRLGSGNTETTAGKFKLSPRALFEFTKINVGGRAHTASLKLRLSSLQSRALLSYNAPYFLNRRDLSLLFTSFADRSKDVRTFTATRREVSFQLEKRLQPATSLLWRYSFRRVTVDASTLRIAPEQIPLFSQPVRVSALALTFIRDRRDNPADARRGQFNSADLAVAVRQLGGQTSFARFFGQNATFHPLGRRIVFARSLRLGVAEPFGARRFATVSDPLAPGGGRTIATREIPLPERFFAGGGTTLRGFGLNQAGPRDPVTGFPVGGNALLILNQELRFPMPAFGGPKFQQNLGGAFFYDAGNVFTRLDRISLRWSPRRPDDINFFSHTVGFGMRYDTPIGPIRLDVGYLLNPARVQIQDVPGQVRGVRQPHFQFFFSIGQTF